MHTSAGFNFLQLSMDLIEFDSCIEKSAGWALHVGHCHFTRQLVCASAWITFNDRIFKRHTRQCMCGYGISEESKTCGYTSSYIFIIAGLLPTRHFGSTCNIECVFGVHLCIRQDQVFEFIRRFELFLNLFFFNSERFVHYFPVRLLCVCCIRNMICCLPFAST